MSPFIIFVIVLTIAYVLYYATIITMDLNAKSKKEEEHEETISASDTKEVEEENTPQTVLEDTKTGGFSFLESTEAQGNPVEEAAETEPAPAIDEGILPETTETPTDANRDNHWVWKTCHHRKTILRMTMTKRLLFQLQCSTKKPHQKKSRKNFLMKARLLTRI